MNPVHLSLKYDIILTFIVSIENFNAEKYFVSFIAVEFTFI